MGKEREPVGESLHRLFLLARAGRSEDPLLFQSLIEFPQQVSHLSGVEFMRSFLGNHAPRPCWVGWRMV